jgi:oxygen-independent coproporphyrinogen III oxidase
MKHSINALKTGEEPIPLIRVHSRGCPLGGAANIHLAQPLGLYVHVPFCVRKCYYCDFNSGPAPGNIREQYVDALVEEIRRSPWRGQAARTVFFGGGTPSELKTEQLGRIANALRESFHFVGMSNVQCPMSNVKGERGKGKGSRQWSVVSGQWSGSQSRTPERPKARTPEPEWTIECNPGTISEESLAGMREMGFNRISLGVQSFHDHHLKALGRIHTAAEAEEGVRAARQAGFTRLNLDLIFCLPGQTLAEWQSDVERALDLEPEHVSLYNLTIEDNTEFGRRHRLGLLSLPDEDLSADMYEWTMDRLARAGFDHYEISNWALAGEECRHNQIYWRNEPFLGFGLSAASFVDGIRWTHTGSMRRYLVTAGREGGPERASEEQLSPAAAAGEAIMLGLRTRDGADLGRLGAEYGFDPEPIWGPLVRQLTEDGLLARERWVVKLTRRGKLLANAVCGEFLDIA